MRITMFVTKDVLQFNLEPESEQEKKFMGILDGYNGQAQIHSGVNLDECRGGYLRNFGEALKSWAVIIKRHPDSVEPPRGG